MQYTVVGFDLSYSMRHIFSPVEEASNPILEQLVTPITEVPVVPLGTS